jgi:Fic family protein
VERAILPTPLLYLSAFFEATRRDYYDLLSGVSERGEWEPWLAYFLNGVARQSEDALGRAERINQKLVEWRNEAAGISSKAPLLLINMLASNPYLTINKVAKQLGVAFTTAQRAVEKLEKLSIVAEVSQAKRDRVYCAKALLSILEEPAKLVPNS